VFNWKTNADNKAMIYSSLRDSLMAGDRLELRSIRCVKQMQAIVEDQGWIGAGPDTGVNDDLMSALTLSHWAWVQWLRMPLVSQQMTWERVKGERPPQNMSNTLSQAFSDFFVGLNRRQRTHVERF
jgi:hypothetical protein